jgi:hypothetical protein
MLVLNWYQDLTPSYSEHLCATCWACSLGSWFSILHGYALGIFHFLLGAAFDTVRLHEFTSSLPECYER